ncbi:MAG: SUMF1/EgtB/PvdO family nonheme iron enzyme [Verrucomicrobiota bacterium]
MGNSSFSLTSTDNRVAPESPEVSARPGDPRAAALDAAFPGALAIEPVLAVEEGASFRVTIADGRKFLAWVVASKLGGLGDADKATLFPDAEGAKGLKHENILPVLHVTGAGGFGVMVTEDFDGEPLMNRLGKTVVPFEEVSQWVESIGSALEAAHEDGVRHRALSPAGILVNDQGEIRVVGIGYANVLFDFWSSLMRPRNRKMLDYLPGELQQGGMAEAKAHCDLFSLGVIVYEGLTGGLPKGSFAALPSQKAGVPTYVDDAVLRAMHGTPEERPQNFQEFRAGFVGERMRDDDFDLGRKRDGEYRHREDRYSRGKLEGMGSWLASWQFKFAVVLGMITLAAMAWILYEQKHLITGSETSGEMMVTSEVFLRVEALLREGKTDSAVAMLMAFAEGGEVSRLDMQRTFDLLVEAGRYEQAKEAMLLMASRVEEGHPEFDVMASMAEDLAKKIDRFLEFDEVARLAKARGDYAAEQKALAKMQEILPGDSKAGLRLGKNPFEVAKALVGAVDQIKTLNEEQGEWHLHLSVTADRARLDLSGNASLSDISPLAGVVLHELNLSNTGVTSISPLSGLPLETLRLDGTEVATLAPLGGMQSLQVLTYRDAKVASSVEVLKQLPGLRSVLGTDGSTPFVRVKSPVEGQKVWIDGSGRVFRALPGRPVMLAELEEGLAKGPDGPRVDVSFEEAEQFCRTLTKEHLKAGYIAKEQYFRLPTDFEWSLAANLPESPLLSPRGRRMQPLSSGEIQRRHEESVVFEINEGEAAAPLASTDALGVGRRGRYEALGGFRDLLANAGEWVQDESNSLGERAIVRGIVGANVTSRLRLRTYEPKEEKRRDVGFRLVLQVAASAEEGQFLGRNGASPADLAKVLVRSDNDFLQKAIKSRLLIKSLEEDDTYRDYFLHSTYGVLRRGDVSYLRVNLPMSWREARTLARKLGGDLVSANDRAELSWLREKILQDGGKQVPYWIGASAKPGSKDWRWSRGDSVPEGFFQAPFAVSDVMGMLLVPDDSGLNLSGEYVTESHSFVIKWASSDGEKVAMW